MVHAVSELIQVIYHNERTNYRQNTHILKKKSRWGGVGAQGRGRRERGREREKKIPKNYNIGKASLFNFALISIQIMGHSYAEHARKILMKGVNLIQAFWGKK